MTLGVSGAFGFSLSADVLEHHELREAMQAAKNAGVKWPMKEMAEVGKASVLKNFDVGGRPNKWLPLKNREGKPLLDSWKMRDSIRHKVIGGMNFKIYSNDIKGKVEAHDQGRPDMEIRPRNKKMLMWKVHGVRRMARFVPHHTIPARPFMHLQAEDTRKMTELVAAAALKSIDKALDDKGIK